MKNAAVVLAALDDHTLHQMMWMGLLLVFWIILGVRLLLNPILRELREIKERLSK